MTKKLVLGAAIGDCVHVAGILNFLAACRRHGYRTVFLGPATPVERLVEEAKRQRPEILAVSYRLTPEAAERLFGELDAALRREGLSGIRHLVRRSVSRWPRSPAGPVCSTACSGTAPTRTSTNG